MYIKYTDILFITYIILTLRIYLIFVADLFHPDFLVVLVTKTTEAMYVVTLGEERHLEAVETFQIIVALPGPTLEEIVIEVVFVELLVVYADVVEDLPEVLRRKL